jgi:putative redox protein
MKSIKVKFNNNNGDELRGILDLPVSKRVHTYVIFAHCFTCNKNLKAIKNISNGLTSNGFGVLRFDFTGLGQSEGEFEDTNFSHNVDDLLAATYFLKENYARPELIIGHSLGGTASLFAAHRLDYLKAVVTIGSPFQPEHVTKLIESQEEEIKTEGRAKVNVGGRNFTIKKDFYDDLKKHKIDDFIGDLKTPFLIFHSPQDQIVAINNAELLYKNAHHPKSFVSLDGADHLMSNPKDSLYIGQVIASWAQRYLDTDEKEIKLKSDHDVIARLNVDDNFTTDMAIGDHNMLADEPESYGGKNLGPNPYEFLSAALASCTAMTVIMYARKKKIPLNNVEVHVSHNKDHCEDCKASNSKNAKIDIFQREVLLEGELDDLQRKKLLKMADKCPVHKTIKSEIEVKTRLVD